MARWITGFILAIAVVLLFLYVDPFYLKNILVLLAVLACLEFLNITITHGALGKKMVGAALTGLGVWFNFFALNLSSILVFIYAVILIGFVIELVGETDVDNKTKIKQTAFFILGVFYTTFLFTLLGKLCDLPHYRFWLFLTLACTHFADTGAFVVGKLFGKTKLAPTLSPGKTVEGVVGAVLFSIIAAFVIRAIFWQDFNAVMILVLGLLIAFFGVLGDLCESLLKRGLGIKDSGTLIPGHGGILDRLDSLLITAPMIYFVAFWIVD